MHPSKPQPLRQTVHQRGNALLFALLALVLTGITAVSTVRNKRLEQKRDAGLAEATLLDTLKSATNNAVFEWLPDIQAGRPFTKNSITVTPVNIGADLTWSPSVDQLRDMGYLPTGWAATSSTLNNAPYRISFRRVPSGCAPSACVVEGQVVIMGPIRDGDADTLIDGVVVGPILTRIGADSGVSLATSRDVVTGFGNTWTLPNPVMGQPPGVVAVRVGTGSSGFGQFVRIGDTRDPNLAGDLSVAGNLAIAGSTRLAGDTTVNGQLAVASPSGPACVTMAPSGVVTITCSGQLNARTGVFSDGNGNTTTVGPAGVTAAGKVTAANGLATASATLFDTSDPYTIRVNSGQMFLWGNGGRLVSFDGGDVVAEKNIVGKRLALAENAVEGSACTPTSGTAAGPTATEYAALADGGLAVCSAGRWMSVMRSATAGTACASNGAYATDPADQQGLICRGGVYVRTAALLSNFVLVQTLEVTLATESVAVPKPACASTGAGAAEPLIILTAGNEAPAFQSPAIITGINRFAQDHGDHWTVHRERSSDRSVVAGTLIASLFCFYR